MSKHQATDDGYGAQVLIELDRIDDRPASEMRAKVDEEVVAQYAEDFDDLPPILVMTDIDDQHWLVDGSYRLRAARQLGYDRVWCRYKPGTYLDAFREASRANEAHGVRVTNEDKRRRVDVFVGRPEATGMSNRQVAEFCGVSLDLVNRRRPTLTVNDSFTDRVEQGKDTRTTDEKYREIEIAIREHPEWSNAWIAEHCRVRRETVAKAREKLGLPPSGHKGGAQRPAVGSDGGADGSAGEPTASTADAVADCGTDDDTPPATGPDADDSEPTSGTASLAGDVEGRDVDDGEPGDGSDPGEAEPSGPACEWEVRYREVDRLARSHFDAMAEDQRGPFAGRVRSLGNELMGQCTLRVDRSHELLI